MSNNNLLLLSDSYKHSHWKQLPPGTTKVYSYFESRGGFAPETVFFGLQYFLKKYLMGQAFSALDIVEAKEVVNSHMGQDTFNFEGWAKLFRKHGRHLPISIRAVPEGTVKPTSHVLMTVENTDDEFPWLTNFLETLLVQVW